MKQFRGIYGILTAAFLENLELDEKSVRRQAEFCVQGGAHGVVVPVNASEFFVLSDEERRSIIRWTVEQVAGRVPGVAGVTTQSAQHSAALAAYAREVGADGVIAAPPCLASLKPGQLVQYYRMIGDAAQLPVFLQNHMPPLGVPMSAETCLEIIREVPYALYVKEETANSSQMITQLGALAADLPEGTYLGTMGGKAAKYVLDEHRRGACGNMPACDIVDVNAKIWNYLEAGDDAAAEELYTRALPLTNMEYMYGHVLYKTVLKERGVIDHACVRTGGDNTLDAFDMLELRRILKTLESDFSV